MQQLHSGSVALVIGVIVAFASPVCAQSPDRQANCAAQAKIAFDDLTHEYRDVLESLNIPFAIMANGYEAHYSGKVERCLFLVRKVASVLERTSYISYLLDVANRNMYALYVSTDGKMESCALIPSVPETKACKDRDEFDAFVAKYMQR